MRFCNCVLAMRGYCCQDGAVNSEARSRLYWWEQQGMGTTTSSGQMYTYGSKAQVRKLKGWGVRDVGRKWMVTNHPTGTQVFHTWEEAMCYANSRPLMMNAVAGASVSGLGTGGYVSTVI